MAYRTYFNDGLNGPEYSQLRLEYDPADPSPHKCRLNLKSYDATIYFRANQCRDLAKQLLALAMILERHEPSPKLSVPEGYDFCRS